LRGEPNVYTLHATNGRWDIFAERRADNLETFNTVLGRIRLIPGIANTETSILLSTHKI
jgi:DNA-binding Lrp family transcriptional regulator